jgi:hypothetical protein
MEAEVPLRLTVRRPLAGVALGVQRGRDELLAPLRASDGCTVFELSARAAGVLPDGRPRLLGPFMQGPPAGRFVYVNVGRRAGQPDSPWDRRAKVPLTGISAAILDAWRGQPGAMLSAEIDGIGRDGGPACAAVKLLGNGWHIVSGSAG